MSHNILYLALNGLLVKVSANAKKPDFFSLAPPALAKYYCSLFVGAKDFTRRYQNASFRDVATDIRRR